MCQSVRSKVLSLGDFWSLASLILRGRQGHLREGGVGFLLQKPGYRSSASALHSASWVSLAKTEGTDFYNLPSGGTHRDPLRAL